MSFFQPEIFLMRPVLFIFPFNLIMIYAIIFFFIIILLSYFRHSLPLL